MMNDQEKLNKKTILIPAVNPKKTSKLRLDREVREIDNQLQQSPLGKQFQIEQRWAVRTRDLQRALLDLEPYIVHFCGHGEGEEGLILEDEKGFVKFVKTEALSNLFEFFTGQVKCVLLNACYSEVQADAIVQYIDYVIGMRKAVPDNLAIAFSTGFYQGLGAGQSIEEAFQVGCDAVKVKVVKFSTLKRKFVIDEDVETNKFILPDYLIPVLKKKVDYSKEVNDKSKMG